MAINISQVQQLLKALGHSPGKIDGIWGSNSQKALDAACKKYGAEGPVPADQNWWKDVKYFKREEFRCKCGGKYCNGFPVEPDRDMVMTLDKMRAQIGYPLIVNSGIRCKKHNAAVGGASASQHLYGTAADISCSASTPSKLKKLAEKLLPNSGGIGLYSWGIHVDSRNAKARWNG